MTRKEANIQTFVVVVFFLNFHSEGYSIQTRYARKCFQLTDEVVMSVVGFQADGTALVKRVKQRLEVSFYFLFFDYVFFFKWN